MSPKSILFKSNDELKRSVLVSLTFLTQFACKSLSYKHQQKVNWELKGIWMTKTKTALLKLTYQIHQVPKNLCIKKLFTNKLNQTPHTLFIHTKKLFKDMSFLFLQLKTLYETAFTRIFWERVNSNLLHALDLVMHDIEWLFTPISTPRKDFYGSMLCMFYPTQILPLNYDLK